MNRIDMTGQGFANVLDPSETHTKIDYSKVFKSRDIEGGDYVHLLNLHSGSSLGVVEDDGGVLKASIRWTPYQEDISLELILVGISLTGEVISEGVSGKMVSFLLPPPLSSERGGYRALSFNPDSGHYEFGVVTTGGEMPKKMHDNSIFYVHQVLPMSDKKEDLKYGDYVVLENIYNKQFFSKGERDGCTLSDHPYFSDHSKDEFSTEMLTTFTHNKGPMYCKSAECEDLSDDNKKYGTYAGCNMLYWQILPSDPIETLAETYTKSKELKELSVDTSHPDVVIYAFIPVFFMVALILIVILYEYF